MKEYLKGIPDKREYKETTSLRFKEDLIEFFSDIGSERTILELGTNHGHTTRVLSFLFNKVITVDWKEEPNLRMARELNKDRDNITYVEKDLYNGMWDFSNFDVVFFDAVHTHEAVLSDINHAISTGKDNMYFVFDDYGHPTSTGPHDIVNDFIRNVKGFERVRHIGEPEGTKLWEKSGRDTALKTSEGIICKYSRTKSWWEE
jgi:SAM-dependent methyltransferase|tara:strand:+ start:2393 stop:3001 length:609 start_codon:yes stop_codon:yes gene_type:complete